MGPGLIRNFLLYLLVANVGSLRAEDRHVDVPFFSLENLRGIFHPKVISETTPDLDGLYDDLYQLKARRRILMNALKAYVKAVENKAPAIECDFLLNDVGVETGRFYTKLGFLVERLGREGAQLSLNNKTLEEEIQRYMHSNVPLTGQRILRYHELNSYDLGVLKEILSRAQENGELLDKALEDMRIEIISFKPRPGSGKVKR